MFYLSIIVAIMCVACLLMGMCIGAILEGQFGKIVEIMEGRKKDESDSDNSSL